MIVKHGILALLTQGPAYGLQLRTELVARTGRAPAVNVGQVYSTLERALASGLVTQDSHTEDGLPLYRLTREGEREARRWLVEPEFAPASAFDDMVCQVLLARSLPGVDPAPLVTRYRDHWAGMAGAGAGAAGEAATAAATSGPGGEPDGLVERSRRRAARALASAALDWLSETERDGGQGWPLARTRPPRGRPRARAGEVSGR